MSAWEISLYRSSAALTFFQKVLYNLLFITSEPCGCMKLLFQLLTVSVSIQWTLPISTTLYLELLSISTKSSVPWTFVYSLKLFLSLLSRTFLTRIFLYLEQNSCVPCDYFPLYFKLFPL